MICDIFLVGNLQIILCKMFGRSIVTFASYFPYHLSYFFDFVLLFIFAT